MQIDLPTVFTTEITNSKFLERMRRKAAKDFKWTRSRSLEDAMYLAYWYHILGQNSQVLVVCDFLCEYQFNGNFALWNWIERTLALRSLISRTGGNTDASHSDVDRIRNTGFIQKRLEGILLPGYHANIDAAIKDCDRTRETSWRAVMLTEQYVILELGGSEALPIEELHEGIYANLTQLQKLAVEGE